MKTKTNIKILTAALLTVALMFTVIPHVYANDSPFNDVAPDFWAYDAIVETYNDGVMTGTAAQIFTPSGKLDMAQFTTILARAFYKDELEAPGVDDDWWDPAYRIAYHDNHNLFGEVHNIAGNTETTREVMAEMMYRVMVDKGIVLPSDGEIQATMNKIPDIASVSSEYRTAVAVCYYLDLLAGVDSKGTFAPKGVLNRAQTAVIYVRLKKALSILGTDLPGTTDPGTTIPVNPNPRTTDPGTPNPNTTQDPVQTPSGATLTNGMPVTEENVLALIEEYRNGKEPGEKAKAAGFTSYEDCSKYDPYEPKYHFYLSDEGYVNGTECAKLAYAFSDDIFGPDAPIREISNPADVRPGDILYTPGHWSISTMHAFDYKGRGPHTQTVGGGSAGSIGWTSGGYGPVSDDCKIYTRYPD